MRKSEFHSFPCVGRAVGCLERNGECRNRQWAWAYPVDKSENDTIDFTSSSAPPKQHGGFAWRFTGTSKQKDFALAKSVRHNFVSDVLLAETISDNLPKRVCHAGYQVCRVLCLHVHGSQPDSFALNADFCLMLTLPGAAAKENSDAYGERTGPRGRRRNPHAIHSRTTPRSQRLSSRGIDCARGAGPARGRACSA